jgi:hypothetical protein
VKTINVVSTKSVFFLMSIWGEAAAPTPWYARLVTSTDNKDVPLNRIADIFLREQAYAELCT